MGWWGAKQINMCSWGQLSEMPNGGPEKTTGGNESRRPPGKVRAMERGVCRVPLDGCGVVVVGETWSTGGIWARGEGGFLGRCLHHSHQGVGSWGPALESRACWVSIRKTKQMTCPSSSTTHCRAGSFQPDSELRPP